MESKPIVCAMCGKDSTQHNRQEVKNCIKTLYALAKKQGKAEKLLKSKPKGKGAREIFNEALAELRQEEEQERQASAGRQRREAQENSPILLNP